MRVKQRLRINAVASVITALIIFLILSAVLLRVNHAMQEARIADDLMSASFERAAIRADYQRTGSERAKEQYIARHEQIGRLLKEALSRFEDGDDKKTIKEMIDNHDSIGRIFAAIVANREGKKSGPSREELSREIENRLLSQLNMRLYKVVLQVRKLQDSSTAALFAALKLGCAGFVSVLVILIAAVMINSWTIGRAITERVSRLREGAAVIGGGDLAHRIDISGDDEFAELSDAFDSMTAKLRGSYHDLEKEIEERKRAEEAVSRSRKTFVELVERSPFGTYIVDSQFRIAMMNASSQTGAFRNVRPVIGRPFAEAMAILWPEPVAAEIIGFFRHTQETGEPYYSRDFINPRHDAEIVEAYEWELHRITLPDGQHGVICYYYDSTKLREAESALRAREVDLSEAQRLAHIGSWYWDAKTDVTTGSDELLRIYGFDPATQTMPDFKEQCGLCYPVEEWERVNAAVQRGLETGVGYELDVHAIRNGKTIWVTTRSEVMRDADNRIVSLRGTVQDITERKRAEEEREISVEFLRLVNESRDIAGLIRAAVTFFHEKAGCEAVGIRLKAGDDYPYFEACGFPEEFILLENNLCDYDGNGVAIRDFAGNPLISCMCGNVICGSFDPSKPFFTEKGSFWTNCTTELLATTTEADRQASTRNRCNGEGYESVALIPLRCGEESVGLLQLNDRQKGRFSASTISLWERLSGYLAVALSKFETDEALRKAHNELAKQMEERTRQLYEKEVLLKEVHHRVKNNLQVISSLVGLQADGSKDETVREVLKDVTYRVRSMALVHEKLYQSADLACIDFAEYVRSLLGYLWRAQGLAASVQLTLDLDAVSLLVDTAVPLGLILNELAGNALKHAFRGRSEGEVTVSLHNSEEGRISLVVRDNGVGLPEGLDWRQAKSLGLRLVQMLAGQVGAGVEVNSMEGTKFEIFFVNKA